MLQFKGIELKCSFGFLTEMAGSETVEILTRLGRANCCKENWVKGDTSLHVSAYEYFSKLQERSYTKKYANLNIHIPSKNSHYYHFASRFGKLA